VFKQVCETCSTLWLDAKTDAVINANRYHRRDVILRDNHLQTVWKFVVNDRHVQRLRQSERRIAEY